MSSQKFSFKDASSSLKDTKLYSAFRILRSEGFRTLLYYLPGMDRIALEKTKKEIETFQDEGSDVNRVLDYAQDFEGYGRYRSIAPMQVDSEICTLVKILQEEQPDTLMEIGTAQGGTLFLWTQALPSVSQFISLDLPGGRFGGGYTKKRVELFEEFTNEELVCIRKDSQNEETLEEIQNILGERKLDFLFIDGDHTYKGVKKDFKRYSALMADGGIIALHDIVDHGPEDDCEVDVFWKEIKQEYETEEIIENSNQGWAGIGLVYMGES